MRRRGLLVSACAAALGAPALAMPTPVRAKEPKLIRFGWANTPAQLIPLIFQNTRILKHFGRSYVARGDYFRGSTPQITGPSSTIAAAKSSGCSNASLYDAQPPIE